MIKKQYLKRKPICKVTFTLPKEAATNAKEVRVLGEFNDWSWEKAPVMKMVKKEFKATLELTTGRPYQFRYMIDKEGWENDWAADDYVTTPYTGIENSVVIVEERLDVAPVTKEKAAAKKVPAAKKTATKKTTVAKATASKKAPVAKKTVTGKKVTAKKAATKVNKSKKA